MKRDWTEIVKDKLSESKTTPPDDLWTAISSELDAAMPPLPAYSKSKQWRWWTVAACLAAAVICGSYFQMPTQQETELTNTMLAGAKSHDGNESNPIDNENPQDVTPYIGKRRAYTSQANCKKDQQSAPIAQNTAIELQQADSVDDLTIDKSAYSENSNSGNDTFITASDRQDTITNITSNTDHRLIAFEVRAIKAIQSKHNDGISVGLYASNTNMPSLGTGAFDGTFGDVCADDTWGGGYVGSSTDGTQASYTLKDVKHRQPLRFGLSVRLPVSSSISLSSGLVYSRLSSTMTWESTKGTSLETDQTLNYIGIPASIEYSLPSYRSAGFYLTAGAMVEKCIYGESKSTNSPLSEKVSENALQLSVFAGAGVQLNLNNHISLYAEPLATYYVDNHSDVINIYKDRKLNLDLRVGFRYTLK